MTNRKLATWSAVAIVIGALLGAPGTSLIVPALVADRPDSIWFYLIPLLGMCSFVVGVVSLIRIAIDVLTSKL